MATSKKPTPASKRKAAAPKKVAAKPVASTARAMDIIPKNRVRPTTTSRPVITTSTPVVADNTLTSSNGAPALQVKRRQITINPPQDSELNKDDVLPDLAVSAPEVAVASQGVSVSDLIAKRKEKKVIEPVEETSASTDEAAPATEPAVVTAEAEPAVSQTPGTTPELPATEPSADDPAAAEAARLLSDAADDTSQPVTTEPAETESTPVVTSEPEVPAQEAVPNADPEPVAPAAATSAEPKPDETPSSDEPAAAPDSVGEILKEEPNQPQAHSQALKDEIKGLNDKSEQSHHNTYDGQPVIVVHKEHGPMSAVAWVLWFFLCLAIAVLIVNFLLDAGFIETSYRIPHTNIL